MKRMKYVYVIFIFRRFQEDSISTYLDAIVNHGLKTIETVAIRVSSVLEWFLFYRNASQRFGLCLFGFQTIKDCVKTWIFGKTSSKVPSFLAGLVSLRSKQFPANGS